MGHLQTVASRTVGITILMFTPYLLYLLLQPQPRPYVQPGLDTVHPVEADCLVVTPRKSNLEQEEEMLIFEIRMLGAVQTTSESWAVTLPLSLRG